MPTVALLPIHIIAGSVGLVSGAVALWVLKGGRLHRKSGVIFVYAMMLVGLTGAGMAVINGQRINLITSTLAFYLVTSALLTVRRRTRGSDWLRAGVMLLGLGIGLLGIKFGFDGINSAAGSIGGYPPGMGFFFGGVALLSALGDLYVMLAQRLHETHRLTRHLWRMCFALFMAAGSFFLGQADVLPEPIRIMPLLAMPVLLVIVLMIHWLVRVMFTQWRPRKQAI
jgi:hypothetical protein